MPHRSWQELLTDPAAERHLLQLYREPTFLHKAVGQWARGALDKGGAAILVGARSNIVAILDRLRDAGLDVATLQCSGRLVTVDAAELLSKFMHGDLPDADKFRAVASAIVERARASCDSSGEREVRAWGEMVNLLYHGGNLPAAQKLESLWNEVIDAHEIRLLCSYGLDNLDPATHSGPLRAVCAGHSRLIPEEDPDRFDRAVSAALIDTFGESEAGIMRVLFAAKRHIPIRMPPAEAVLVALNETQPDVARRVLASTRAHLQRTVA